MKALKKLLIIILVLVVLVAGGLFAVAAFAPLDKVEQMAVEMVKQQTGRDLSFKNTKVMFWPNIGVRLQNVALSNPDWAASDSMMTLDEMDVRLALRPLLDKQIQIKRFVLNKPVINLEVGADGRQNWVFTPAKPAQETPAATGEADAEKSGGGFDAAGFKMDEFEIRQGRLSFTDAQNKTGHTVENINITISFPDIDSAFQMDGALQYLGKRVQLVATLEAPKAFIEGRASAGSLIVDSDDLDAKINGTFKSKETLLSDARIEASVHSLSSLLAWVGGGAPQNLPFEKVSFQSKAEASADLLKLTDASLTLDDVSATGDVTLKLGGAKPDVFARLAIGKLNLDRFAKAAVQKQDSGAAPADVPAQDWDATPIDFSGLKAVNADLVLKTQGFSVKGAEVGPSTLTALLKNGVLEASSSEAALFGGVFSSALTLNAAQATPAQSFTFNMKGVDAHPVLKTFAGFDKLSGKADANVSLTASGNSQKSIIGNLNGKGDVMFRNGAITGIDAVNIAQMIQSGLKDAGIGGGKTEFVEMGGTFTIAKGVAHNDDLKLRGPLVQVTGAGDVDLPKKYVKYLVKPLLTASSAEENAGGITVLVHIVGPFSNIRVKPDFAAAVKDVFKDPAALKEQGKIIEDNFKEIKKDPGKAIENLLGGGGLFGKKNAPAPAPAPEAETAPATEGAAQEGENAP